MPAWTPALSTGDAKIDDQHREIFRRFDLLHAAMLRGDRHESGRLFEFLGGYVGEHFSAEERAMRTAAYPLADEHRSAHAAFVREYLAVGKALEAGGPSATVALKLSDWLASWLQGHILRADVELARHLVQVNFVLDDVS
jgi:hemerythrin